MGDQSINSSTRKLIVSMGPNMLWDKFAPPIFDHKIKWKFFDARGKNNWEQWIKIPNLARLMSSYRCVKYVQKNSPDLLITHSPEIAFWCAFFLSIFKLKTRHLAWAFNFFCLPRGMKLFLLKIYFSRVDKFIVYSTMEKSLYSTYFGISEDRLYFMRWGVGVPHVSKSDVPLEKGEYICSIGGNYRDYKTLIGAMRKLPEIKLILVTRQASLNELNINAPPNIKFLADIPSSDCMNLLNYSKFVVLLLKGAEVACGHVTLIAAMHLGKTVIASEVPGLGDYVEDGKNAVTVPLVSVEELVQKINQLWSDPGICEVLGKNAQMFASKYCSEEITIHELKRLITEFKLMPTLAEE